MNDIQSICWALSSRLADAYACDRFGEGLLITMPLAYPDGQAVQIYAEQKGDEVRLGDLAGGTSHLAARGWKPGRTGRIDARIRDILSTYAVSLQNEHEIGLTAAFLEAPKAAHRVAMASKEVGDLEVMLTFKRSSDLPSRVADFFQSHHITGYERRKRVPGTSGKEHVIDLLFRGDNPTFVESLSASHGSHEQKLHRIIVTFLDLDEGEKLIVSDGTLGAADERQLAKVSDDLFKWTNSGDRAKLEERLARYKVPATGAP